MLNKYLIVADDFTGANDTGVQMRRRGFPTHVMFAGRTIPAGDHSLVIDTESRGMMGEEAKEATAKAVEKVDFSSFKYVIKKVDSTLRGNVAEEILAVDRAFGSELVIFAPALPDLDRTTVDGIHRLKGVRITETELAKDPKKPVVEDNLARILERVYDEKVTYVSLDEIRTGRIALEGGRLFTFDAVLNSDLQAVIGAALETGKKILWVGAAAMADNLMERESKTYPALGIAASVSSVTGTQIRAAEAAGVALVSVPVHEVLAGKTDTASYVEAAVESLKAGKDTILLSSSSYDRAQLAFSEEEGRKKGMETWQVSEYVQGLMGAMAKTIFEQVPVCGVFLTGGDTAMGVLESLKADGSSILSEIAVGIPMMQLVGGSMDGLKVVTKAGAFGKEDAILFAFRKLKEK
ncbi:MAG: four-carbon acid sugar kinase family protein [Lachnospiraceae bacterium]|nr:four-carbon acid sugar kinase family protein [Lachnospiraceae bacterium]